MSIIDKVKEKVEQAKGKIEEKVGQAKGDPSMADRGAARTADAKVGEKVADVDTGLSGLGNQIKGKAKDIAGAVTGDTGMQGEGKLDQLKGKIQQKLS